MRSRRRTFGHFLTAEEVPRWFGLSLVLIYLVGLGSVAHFGIIQARRESAAHLQRSSRHAVRLLADRLSALGGKEASGSESVGAYRRVLREFAANVPTRSLRIVDDRGHVIAATGPAEIHDVVAHELTDGTKEGARAVSLIEVAGQTAPDILIRTRLNITAFKRAQPGESLAGDAAPSVSGAVPSSQVPDDDAAAYFLEARLSPEPPGVSDLADQARTLAVVLVVLGALFVVYRCLREQLRGMSRIAERLQSPRDCLEDELNSLRLADTHDGVTTAWNELIDLTQGLLESSQRLEANEELSQALQRSGGSALAEALNAVPDGIAYITDEARFEYVNSAACRLFGWDAQEVGKTTLHDAQSQGIGARVLDLVRDALRPDGTFEARNEVLAMDDENAGDRSSYRIRLVPLQRTQREGECVLMIRDVSQQVRADHAREEFITQVTHELRTPLTNIRAYSETLSSGMFDDPGVMTECYNVITKETRRLSRLVEDILSVSQMEVGTIELDVGSVDLAVLLGDGVRDVRGLADEKGIDIQLALSSKLEPIRGDRDKLAVVINNLLGNAIKYTPENGHVVVGCQLGTDTVVITVKDNGIGIDPADHARVFEKFQRVNDPAVQDEPGTGIGLYTAREIARRHGGDIELISEKGKGSTFMVRLPHRGSRAASLSTAEEV